MDVRTVKWVVIGAILWFAFAGCAGREMSSPNAAVEPTPGHPEEAEDVNDKTTSKFCPDPPIVKRKDLTPEQKRMIVLNVTRGPEALKGHLFLSMFLDDDDLPDNLVMTQDTRNYLPRDPNDKSFSKHCGYCSGLALWQGGFDDTFYRLVDIRYIFPTEIEAERYLIEQLKAMSEGQPRIPNAPLKGENCSVFGGTVEILGVMLTHFYYIFRVQNVVVKLYVAEGPEIVEDNKRLRIEHVAELSEKCVQRIVAYNHEAKSSSMPIGTP